jgi:hypothetical protein
MLAYFRRDAAGRGVHRLASSQLASQFASTAHTHTHAAARPHPPPPACAQAQAARGTGPRWGGSSCRCVCSALSGARPSCSPISALLCSPRERQPTPTASALVSAWSLLVRARRTRALGRAPPSSPSRARPRPRLRPGPGLPPRRPSDRPARRPYPRASRPSAPSCSRPSACVCRPRSPARPVRSVRPANAGCVHMPPSAALRVGLSGVCCACGVRVCQSPSASVARLLSPTPPAQPSAPPSAPAHEDPLLRGLVELPACLRSDHSDARLGSTHTHRTPRASSFIPRPSPVHNKNPFCCRLRAVSCWLCAARQLGEDRRQRGPDSRAPQRRRPGWWFGAALRAGQRRQAWTAMPITRPHANCSSRMGRSGRVEMRVHGHTSDTCSPSG